jgi:hypothetical protein
MAEFVGFVELDGTFTGWLQVADSNKQPVAPDALPTFRVYSSSGILSAVAGTVANAHTGTITGATNATPIVLTSAAHGLQTGQRVTISGVVGNGAANTTAVVTRIDANTFSVAVSGSGGYVSGGTFKVTGFYKYTIAATGGNGFEAGENYDVHFSWAVSSAARAETHSFAVS